MAVLQATQITGGLTMHGMAAGFMKINAEGAVVMDTNTYLSSGSYLPLSGGTMSGKILAVSVGTGTYDGAIELRETGYASSGQSAWGYSPAITFHWGNRYAKRFGMRADGLFAVDDEPLALRSWVTSQGYITSYTETDTLATVTSRGATTSSPITISTGGSQPLSLTTSSGSPWHIALNRTDLGLTSRVFAHNSPYNGWYFEHNISIAGNTNWHSGNLTNLNQLTNGPGYITSSALSSYLPLSGGTMSGNVQFNSNLLQFNNNGVRSWNMGISGGNLNVYSVDGSGSLLYNGRPLRDSYYRTYSGFSDYYAGGTGGWYRVAQITLTSNCGGAVLYGTLYDHRYDGADAYQIAVVARSECDFSSNNESHYINVGCTILGSTNYSDYRSKIRVILSASSTNSRTYELQFYESPWNNDTWQLETTGWTIYTSPQAASGGTGTARVNYISNQSADYQRANTATYSPIYYDSSNTSYYLDPTSTTSIRTVGSWRSDSSSWDGEFSGKIQYHSNHWYFQSGDLWIFRNAGGSNVFSVNQSGSGTFSGTVSASNISTGVTASHIVQRDANGYIYANHVNFSTGESENPTISSFITSNGDGWSRKSSLQHVRNQLGNYGGWITGYTETDTLASVTGRGASTSTLTTLSGGLILETSYRFNRVYGFGNYSANFSNSVSTTETWFRLGNASPFSQTRIYYRAGSGTSEEEGEIKISNTCGQPFIEWTRNTYNYHIREVRCRMQGSCQPCEVWVLVRHGNGYGGVNTNFQWQIHSGTDSGFSVVNATGTPGTGTNEVSINTTDGYFYRNTGNIGIGGTLTANSIVKSGGTSSQFLKADGSVDSNSYVTGGPYLPTAGGTLTGSLQITGGRLTVSTGGANTYGVVAGYENNNHLMTMRGQITGTTSSPTITGAHQMTFVEYAEANDSTGWYFKTSQPGTYTEVARITRTGINWNGNTVWHSGNLTNLNQLTNGPGYITSYTETDTLASVTGRGASTSTAITVNNKIEVSRNGSYGGYVDADLIVGHGGNDRRGYGGTGGSNIMLRSSSKSTITALDENQNLGQLSYENLVWTIGEDIGWGAQKVYFPGQIVGKFASSSNPDYPNPLWLWASADSDAIVIQNTTSGGNATKIYFRDSNGIIQTSNSELRLRTSNSNTLSAYLNGGDWYATGSMRAPIFYDSENTGYYGDFASTSRLNVLDANSIYTSGGLSTNGGNSLLGVQSPGGASRANGGSTETGAFKITFPAGIPVYGMFKLVIHIYEYGQRGNGYEIHCGGHMYPNYMHNRFQVQYGSSNTPLNVRYGNDGTYGCIWIGNIDTTWSYPQIWVSEFMMGYSNTSWTTWRSGWNISLVTSYGNSGAMDGPYTCDYGYAASAGSASTSSQVTINYNDNSNANYQLLWGSGNNVYGTAGVYVNPADDRVYANYFSSAYYMDVYTSAGSDYLRITDNQVYRPNGGILYLNWSSNANVALTGPSGGNVGVGNNSPSYKMHVSGDIYANGGWLRVSGGSGLYFESYGGGWHMQDSSYMRAYNGKSVHMNGGSVDYVGSLYLESGGQGVHLQPNTGSYGSLQVTGSTGGWHGIRFTGNNVNLMVNTTEVGFHNNASGWQMRWESGTGYVHKGSTGGGTSATILDSSNFGSWAAPRNYLDGLSVGFHVYGDANTYYPVLISAHGHFGMHRYSISRAYYDTAPWDPINTGAHKGGLTLTFDWSSDIAWGGNDKSYRIIQFSETYTTMVAGMALPVTGGMLVWLRGGGAGGAFYRLHTPGGLTASATAYMSGYTAANGAVYGIRSDTSNVNSEIRSRFPVRDSGNSDMYVNNNIVWHQGNLTNLNQLTNGPGYITSYTETDTLATVTSRGTTTTSSVKFGSHVDLNPTNSAFRFYDGSTFRGGFGLDSWGHGGSDANLVLYVNGDNTLFFSTSGTKRASLSSSAFNSLVALQQSGNQVLHAGNYNSYAPTLTGGGASGTWGINITGNAATATSATSASTASYASDTNLLDGIDSTGFYRQWTAPGGAIAPATGLNAGDAGWSAFDGYGGPVPNYPAATTQWWVGLWQGGNASRGIQLAGGYSDTELYYRKGSTSWQSWIRILNSSNYTEYAVQTTTQSNWNSYSVIGNVVGMLAWKNYGNGHVIFDASQSTSPTGSSVNNTNATYAWTGTYPTLMGWNGSQTYGVRVDSARISDNTSGNSATTSQTNFTALTVNSNTVLHAGNYNSYSPTLTGGGASGTWGINITGNAASASSVAWGNVSGRPSALSQFSNDSGYITSSGSISGNAGSANVATYARRIDGVSRVQITVGGNASTFYPVAISTGAGSTSQQYSEFVIERGGYDDPGYTGVGFSTFNARFSYKPSGWGYGAVYWNLEQLGQTTTMLADYDDYYQASQFVVWLRGATTYWLWSVVGGIGVIFENTSGTSYNATYRTFGTTTTVAAKASNNRNFYGNLRVDNNIYAGGGLISGYNVELGGSDAGNVVLSTYNNRNLRLTGTGGSDVGICGRRSGGSFGFQVYGEGTAYGFLNSEWGAWNLKKVISGALYMNDNNSYYINTTGDSYFSGALTLGGALAVAGVSTLNGQVNINRHIDANTNWGSCSCTTIFVGWSTSKVVIGNGNSGGHDYANGLGSNSVVSTNPFYCYQDITAYSDSRVKENVEVVDNAIEKVKAIRGVTFTRNDVEDKNKRHAGVIAQEVLAVLPEAVSEDLNGHYSVAYGNLNALLIEAIKEQQTQIEELKNEIKELKNK